MNLSGSFRGLMVVVVAKLLLGVSQVYAEESSAEAGSISAESLFGDGERISEGNISADVKLCISRVCVGGYLSDYFDRIDVEKVKIDSEGNVYQASFNRCEQSRLESIRELQAIQKAYGNSALVQLKLHELGSSEKCVNLAKKAVQDYARELAAVRDNTSMFMNAWSLFNSADVSGIVMKHPEAKLLERDHVEKYGKDKPTGILEVMARTNLGSFRDFEGTALMCQPVLATGTIDNGDLRIVALQEQKSHRFIIIYVSSSLSNITLAQAKSAERQYRDKFGRYIYNKGDGGSPYDGEYPETYYKPVGYSINESSFFIEITHPLFRGRSGSSKGMPLEFKGQFSYMRSVVMNGWRFDNVENIADDYLEDKECKVKVEKMSEIKIK